MCAIRKICLRRRISIVGVVAVEFVKGMLPDVEDTTITIVEYLTFDPHRWETTERDKSVDRPVSSARFRRRIITMKK